MNYKRFYDRISAPLRSYAKVLEDFLPAFSYISYLGLAKEWLVCSLYDSAYYGGKPFPSFSWS